MNQGNKEARKGVKRGQATKEQLNQFVPGVVQKDLGIEHVRARVHTATVGLGRIFEDPYKNAEGVEEVRVVWVIDLGSSVRPDSVDQTLGECGLLKEGIDRRTTVAALCSHRVWVESGVKMVELTWAVPLSCCGHNAELLEAN